MSSSSPKSASGSAICSAPSVTPDTVSVRRVILHNRPGIIDVVVWTGVEGDALQIVTSKHQAFRITELQLPGGAVSAWPATEVVLHDFNLVILLDIDVMVTADILCIRWRLSLSAYRMKVWANARSACATACSKAANRVSFSASCNWKPKKKRSPMNSAIC